MSVDFTPSRGEYTELKPFRYWCQKVLPLVYDDSLSYYELLSKVLDSLNKAMEDVETLNDDVTALYTAYTALQDWITDYVEAFFEGEGVQNAVNAKIDAMVVSGVFGTIVNDKVATQINAVVANQIGAVVQGQLPSVVQTQIPGVVQGQLPGVVNNQIGGVVDDWLDAHITPDTTLLDKTINATNKAPSAYDMKNMLQAMKSNYSFIDKYTMFDYPGDINTGRNDLAVMEYMTRTWLETVSNKTVFIQIVKKGNSLNLYNANNNEVHCYPSLIPITRNLLPPLSADFATVSQTMPTIPNVVTSYNKNAILDYFINLKSGNTVKIVVDIPVTVTGTENPVVCLTGWKLVKVYVSGNNIVSQNLADFTVTGSVASGNIHAECEYTFGDINKETYEDPATVGFGLAILTGDTSVELTTYQESGFEEGVTYSDNTNFFPKDSGFNMTITGEVIDNELADLQEGLNNSLTFESQSGVGINSLGNLTESVNSTATDFIPVFEGEKVHFKNLYLAGVRSVCTYNADKVKLRTVITGSTDTECVVTVQEGEAYIRATGNATGATAKVIDISEIVQNTRFDLDDTIGDVNDIKVAIGNYEPTLEKTDGYFINAAGNLDVSANSCATEEYIPVIPGQTIYLSNLKLTSARSVCGYTINKTFAKRIAGASDDTSITYTVEDGIYYIRATGSVGVAPKIKYGDLISAADKISGSTVRDAVFVATTGNDDTGDGTYEYPFASVNRALKSNTENIYVSGGVYDEQINLANTTKTHIRIVNANKDTKVVFQRSDAVIATSETAVSGYTNVYSASTTKTFDANNLWIYQDGIPDAGTIITASERHPAQKGRGYRCLDTKIVKCTSTTLSDALAEIESSDAYKWFVDSGTIYFSRPQAVSASNPICADFNFTLFANAQHYQSVEISGINTKYMRINLNDMKNAKAVDCCASNVFGAGAFTYSSRNTTLIRCEASCCVNGANGDGFNGAASFTGDADASQTTTEIRDCWAHDNNDDGYSDHNRSDVAIYGGLYEYNKKAGVTPSYGTNCACYDVLSRKNQRGFLLTGSSSDGSKTSSAILYNCVADNNSGRTDSCGFSINVNGGTMTLVDCFSMNTPTGYRSETGSTLILINCKVASVELEKFGSGTFTIINGNSLS